jgi:TatD DNase family protein
MELIDTHAHLYADEFNGDRADVIGRAAESGVRAIFLPNVDSASIEPMLALEAAYPGVCFAMMGLHPCSVGENYRDELAIVRDWLNRRHFCAVGEIGIDLYWDKTYRTQQEEAFLLQAAWAVELDLPIVIHARESLDIILDLLQPISGSKLRGIFHCFSGSAGQAARIVELGFLLGIGGVLTYKKSGLEEVLKTVPLSSLVLETDAPYLSPVPFRGKRNESAYVAYVAGQLSRIYETTPEQIGWQTAQTAKALFRVELS